MLHKRSSQNLDFVLLLLVIAFVLFGLLMVYSASFIYAQEKTGDGFAFIRKQFIYAGIGFVFLALSYRLNYRKWEDWAYPLLIFAICLLVGTFLPGLGQKVGGARRWLGWGGFRFQPGEFAKFSVIIFVARQLTRKSDRLNTLTAGLLSHLIVPAPILVLLLLQPDFGTTVIVTMVIFSLLFIAGISLRYWLGALSLAGIIGGFLIFGTAYRRARWLTFLNPWSDPSGKGFQVLQSLVGLQQGGIWGVGLGNGKEKLFYLPEAHNDFIFSVIGEELGFLGIVVILGAYLYFLHHGLKIAWNAYKIDQDRFGMFLAAGITLAIGYQAFVNIAVVMGLVPTKGLTLPLISYGGSSLVVDLLMLGILLSVARGRVR